MIELVQGDDEWTIASPRLRLSFVRDGDRWAHSITVATGAGWHPVVRSVEGGSDPRRVVSPTYQEVQLRDDAGSGQAFLVGKFGPHHFSAVFTVRETPEAAALEVDLADRCREVVEFLGCTYAVDRSPGDLADTGPSRLAWSLGMGQLALTASEPASLSLGEGGRAATRVRVEAPIDRSVHTQRCLYRWCWSTGSR